MNKYVNITKKIVLIISLIIYIYLVFIGRNQYIYNISYNNSIIFIILISIFIYICGMLDNKYNENINLYIILYFILLISVTFVIGRDVFRLYDWAYTGQYIPFHTITSQFKYGSNLSIIKNILGNSIMLIPLSLLLMIKNTKYKNIFRQLIIILPIIISIEFLQAYSHTGSFDIDYIILNYFSTIIFTFLITIFSLIDKIRKLFFTNFNLNKTIKYILYYFILIILLVYIIYLFI